MYISRILILLWVVLGLSYTLANPVSARFVTGKIKQTFSGESFLQLKDGKAFCYDGKSLYEIDSCKLKLNPVKTAPQAVLRMGLGQDNRLWGVQKKGKNFILLLEDGAKWKALDLPKHLHFKRSDYFSIALRNSQVVILQEPDLYFFDGKKWNERKCPAVEEDSGMILQKPNAGCLYPFKILIGNGVLYLGYSAGEFGGSLVVLNLKNGKTKITNFDNPLSDMRIDGQNRLWFSTALSHLNLLDSEIFRIDNARLKLICSVGGEMAPGQRDIPQNMYSFIKTSGENWNFNATEIEKIIETPEGKLVFVTLDEGLFCLSKGGMKRIGKFWKKPINPLDCAVNGEGSVFILHNDHLEISKINSELLRQP